LAFPLRVAGDLVGLWLLGRRDPDDLYTQSELPVLQSISHQTAFVLANIRQAELLQALYQANVERQEAEQSELALLLHDEVLNPLGLLVDQVDPPAASPEFYAIYTALTTSIRQTIQGLRPAMLDYGLRAGLTELVDELIDRAGDQVAIQLEIPQTDVRYDPKVEQHLFRIVQQACENALRHAQARNVRICGELGPEQVSLEVEDDGIGFPAGEQLDLNGLLKEKHYGLAGMHDRAKFIKGRLQVRSAPGAGTRVSVQWTPDKAAGNGLGPMLAE
jgi:signal transduction histidine kinase